MNCRILLRFSLLACASVLSAQPINPLALKPGDHVAIIGSALPDRFQHSAWLETLIYAAYPQYDLVIRNLAAAGDEVVTRHRSENFGTPDDWLKRTQADVILAFFGFNESFQGYQGLEKFKADLDKYLKETRAQNYSGKGSPRIVLFSPIATEKHRDPNFPDPAATNDRLRDYAAAMAEVAKANQVQWVDLFNPSQNMYATAASAGRSLTVNGIYLTDAGDQQLAPFLFTELFGQAPPAGNFDSLRAAIQEKNAQWHARYRTVDGYNVYGGRSQLSFESGKGGPKVTNYEIMQEEMSQRDVLTANRDKRIWAVAKGSDLMVEDSNLPPVRSVKSNKPGPNPDQSHPYLSGQEAISKMTVHSGMSVNLFATEEKFPELINPVQMAWDTRGRLWVAAWRNYPERTPTSKIGDSLLVFEDTDGDGKADTCQHFIDDLNAPTGFQFYKDGVLLMQAPDLWFVRDTDGDGKADWKERVLMGMDSADSHHTANAICLDPGGAIYLSDGVFHRTQVETASGPVRNNDAAIYRFEPRTGKFETYIPYGFANPHGRVFDYWGVDLVTDATGNNTYYGPAFSGYLDYPAKHPGMKEFWNRPSRPCPGTAMLTSRHFPEEFQGNFLNCNVISFQGIYRVKISEDGSGLRGETQENLVSSSDPNFRPSAVNVGPDGAIYFADWHNTIIGHMQHHIRDPNRGHEHGRIYRITYPGRPLMKPALIAGQPIPALLELLKEPENQTRELAKVELGARDTAQVISALQSWTKALDRKDPAYEHHMMEALWVHQWQNVVNLDLLKRMLGSPEPRARAAASRVMCYWRDRVPESLSWLKIQAADESPRVRLEAVRTASFYRTAEAAEVALDTLRHSTDYYLDYVLKETLRQLQPIWRKAIASGKPFAADNPAGLEYLIGSVSAAELLKMPKTAVVLEAILLRSGIQDSDRNVALDGLAKERKTSRVTQLLRMLQLPRSAESGAAANLARLLPAQLMEELKPARQTLTQLASKAPSSEVRQAAWAGLAVADDSFDRTWTEAATSTTALTELVGGIPLIPDPDFRVKAYSAVKRLLTERPAESAGSRSAAPSLCRFVRVELPRRGTLTLAEVEVFSDGRNIAPQGKAKQSSTTNGGLASRAIDGRTDGTFGSGTQTHSQENEDHPWWEVDLGREQQVDSVVIWNRTENELGNRLDGFTLTILDGNHQEILTKAGNPAPRESARIQVGGNPTAGLRRAAIRAIVTMNHEPEAVFSDLSRLIAQGDEVAVAAQGLRALPRSTWPKAVAGNAAVSLVSWAKTIPAAQRTSQDYVETVQFAGDLAGLLPSAQAQGLRKDLRELRVPVFVIRTVREQMRYDTPRLVAEAGKAVEIIVENTDFMPHNLVIVRPGTRDKVGTAAAVMKPEDTDGRGRAYVPNTPDVVSATKLLESGQRATLSITVPNEEGEFEYVCTFPGHHQLMWGKLIVTRDVDAYLQAHPEAPVPPPPPSLDGEHHHGK